jgi:hypothetical protein
LLLVGKVATSILHFTLSKIGFLQFKQSEINTPICHESWLDILFFDIQLVENCLENSENQKTGKTSSSVAPGARRVLERAVASVLLARGASSQSAIYTVAFSDIFKWFFRVCSQSKD